MSIFFILLFLAIVLEIVERQANQGVPLFGFDALAF